MDVLHSLACSVNTEVVHSVPQDVSSEIMKEMQAKPDLIIGNYSDGNLVATLLAHKLGVTQVCLIVHEVYLESS